MAKTTRTATPATVRTHYVADQFRPAAGAMLFAHTAAFFELSGFGSGKVLPRATIIQAMGARAVKYHTDRGNFEHAETGMRLSPMGKEYFNEIRAKAIPEYVNQYKEVMTTGKTNPLVKNAIGIKPV